MTPRGAPAARSAALPSVAEIASASTDELIAVLAAAASPPTAAQAHALRDRAAAFYLAEPARAMRLARAVRSACQHPDAELTARAWAARCEAEASLYGGRIAAASRIYEDATTLWEATGDEQALGELLVGRVHVLGLAGDEAASRALATRTEAMLRRTGNALYLAKLLLNRGNAAYHAERYRDAFEAYRAAESALQASGVEDSTWAMLTLNLAIACTNLARIADARTFFARCTEWCARLDLPFAAAHAQFNQSLLEARAGDYRAALLLLERADAVFAAQDAHDMRAAAARAQATLYLALGLIDEAIDCATRAVDGFTLEGMPLDAMLARLTLARAYAAQRRPRLAYPLFDEVRAFFRARRIGPRQGEVLLDLAQLHLAEGATAEARAAAQRAAAVFARAQLPAWEADARRWWAEAWLAEGKPARAEAVLRGVDPRREGIPVRVRAGVWAARGRAALHAGRRAAAGRALQRAADLVEAQRALLPSAETRQRSLAAFARVYDDILASELAAPAPHATRIIDTIERARGRGFRDSLAEGRAGLPADIASARAQLGVLTQQIEDRELTRGVAGADPVAARLRTDAVRLEREVLRALTHAEARLSGHGGRATRAPSARARAALREGEVALLYFVAGDRVIAATLSRDGATVHVLPHTAGALHAVIDRVRFLLESLLVTTSAGSANMRFLRRSADAALTEAYRAVVEPLAAHLEGATSVLVSPHGFLHGVPFECLHDGDDYLDRRATWLRLPTLDLLARRDAPLPPRPPLTLAACGLASDDLPAVARELAAVAARLAPAPCRVDARASAADILRAVQDAALVHVSTHGAFRADNPLFSRLSTRDGGLFLADLFGRRATPELVVLSACQSGQVFTRDGDDLEGVAHGFLAMGARQLVASRWRVDDAATASLMEAFYEAYAGEGEERGDAAAALRSAAHAVRQRWDHPFYWGGFSAYGLA